MLSLLIGSMPAEGPAALSRLDMPFILLTDPIDHAYQLAAEPVRVIDVPFKNDPLCILKLPFSEKITNVFSFTELGLLPAALLAEALNISTVPVATVLKTRNKFFMRCVLKGQIAQPEFGLVGDKSPHEIPYPVIVKPIDSSGSRGVEYITDPVTFERRAAQGDVCLWEQYIDGPEFSVEAVTWDGKHQILGITEKITTGAPNFVEVGHFVPARITPEDARNITQAVGQCLDALGVNKGASHTEVKYVNSQTILIETHTRAGGDRIPLLTKLVSGYDQHELAVRSILGTGPLSAKEKVFNYAGVKYFRWPQGIVTDIEGIDECQNMPGVVEFELKITKGSHMPTWKHTHDRPGFVVAGGKSAQEVEARLTAAENMIKVSYNT